MPRQWAGFFVHQGNQAQDVLPGFFETVSREQPEWRIGATVFLPRYRPETSAAIASNFDSHADFVIADPETHRLELPFADRGRGRDYLAYLQESDPIANRQRFVRDVLDAQTGVDRSVLVTPWLTHGTDAMGRHLRATVRFVDESTSYTAVEGRELLIGAAATEAVIADDDARGDFLDELVELPAIPVYFRMLVNPPESFSQYRNESVLRGLRNFVTVLAENGRPALLPQAGLAGWPMLSFGALAFGSGINASLQRFAASSGFGTPLDWYFLPQLLGFVLRDEVPYLERVAGFTPCDCPFCEQIEFDSTDPWNRNSAGLHYLWWCARLAHEAPSLTPMQQQIEAALSFWNEVQQSSLVLDPRSEPKHLEIWSQIVA